MIQTLIPDPSPKTEKRFGRRELGPYATTFSPTFSLHHAIVRLIPSSSCTFGSHPNSRFASEQSRYKLVLIVGWDKSCSMASDFPECATIFSTSCLMGIA